MNSKCAKNCDAKIRGIPVLFENDECMALDKPAGLAVQGGAGVGVSLDSILEAEFPQRPLLVHRLDKDTSGVILVAKNREAAAFFGGLFSAENRGDGVIKRYLALCKGTPTPEAGGVKFDLEVKGVWKTAETRYKKINERRIAIEGNDELFSLLEIELGTGRMHQIRRHLASIGNPIAGDDKYGDFKLNKRLRKRFGVKRLLLHASRLIIPAAAISKRSGGYAVFEIDVSSPLPDYFDFF
ncbi:MAG: RluA family pseudouridine synthase [Treponema sp.]|nr:RluA family pseudouridine synthase [Treponema sp.]